MTFTSLKIEADNETIDLNLMILVWKGTYKIISPFVGCL